MLYESLLNNLGSIIDLHTDLIYKNYLVSELINLCCKTPSLDLKQLIKVLITYFGCNSDDKKKDFLRLLLVYEKLDDVLKEGPVDQVSF